MSEIVIKKSDLEQIIKTEIQKIIFVISDDNNLNQKELLQNTLSKWELNLTKNYSNFFQNKKSRPINPNNYCFSRKPNLERCTRNRKKGSDYCASHQFNRPYGRIDEKPDPKLIKKKDKNKKCNLVIRLEPITVAEKQYFMDQKKHLYIQEKDNGKDKYRHIGDWDETSKTIVLKKAKQETKKK